jgi:tripartite-type tricarboxylate transporter receptor subunit TctC
MALASVGANAEYPDKPIRMVTAGAPGTGSDNITRLFAEKMSGILKESFIVENKPGAGGSLAMSYVARAPADGYTIILGSFSGNVLVPASNPNINYDMARDFTPIGQIASAPTMVIAANDFPVNTVQELAELSKKTPGGVQYATWGFGSTGHFCGELLNHSLQAHLAHIPYKSVAQTVTDLLGGHINVAVVDMITGTTLAQSGRVKPLILCVDGSRLFPNVPSYVDENITFNGQKPTVARWVMYAPSGTPEPVMKKLASALEQTIKMPDVNEWLIQQGNSPAFLGGEEARKADLADQVFWRKVADGLGIKVK